MSKLIGPMLATLALHAGFMTLYVGKHHWDASILACVGRNRAGEPPYEAVTIAGGPNGYDGQFYYVIARAPWSRHPRQTQGIDNPAARQMRIFYPAVCWLLTGGHARTLFWVMPAVNLAALTCLAGVGGWAALRFGFSPWWGFALPLAINAGMPALHDLTDTFAMLGLFGLLASWVLRSRAWVIGLWAAIALLSREQNVAIVGLMLVVALVRGRWSVAISLSAAAALWAIWVGCLWIGYGEWPFLPSQGNFAEPFAGMRFRWTHPGGNDYFSRRLAIILMASMLHLTFEIGMAVWMSSRPGNRLVKLAMLAGVLLAFVGGQNIYEDFYSYTRVFVWVPLGIWLGAMQLGRVGPLVLLTPAALWNTVAALGYV
jgi:hypothetical protein